MTNRTDLQNEYRELINNLNRTNRKENQKTELIFSIQELIKNQRNLAVTVNFEKYLSLGEFTHTSRLLIDSSFKFQDFAEYLQIQSKTPKLIKKSF